MSPRGEIAKPPCGELTARPFGCQLVPIHLNPHGEEARSAVSNHVAPLVPFILRDAASRLLQRRGRSRCAGMRFDSCVGWAKAHRAVPTIRPRSRRWNGGHAEPVIGRAFARPGGFAHPCISALVYPDIVP